MTNTLAFKTVDFPIYRLAADYPKQRWCREEDVVALEHALRCALKRTEKLRAELNAFRKPLDQEIREVGDDVEIDVLVNGSRV